MGMYAEKLTQLQSTPGGQANYDFRVRMIGQLRALIGGMDENSAAQWLDCPVEIIRKLRGNDILYFRPTRLLRLADAAGFEVHVNLVERKNYAGHLPRANGQAEGSRIG